MTKCYRGIMKIALSSFYKHPLMHTRQSPKLRTRLCTTVLAVLIVVWNLPLAAQTLFAWPSTMPDVTRHTTIEGCMAAVYRISDSAENRSPVLKDTLPHLNDVVPLELHPRVVETAARCSARFSPDSVPLSDFLPMLGLFLQANRDTDAVTLITRRLAETPEARDSSLSLTKGTLLLLRDTIVGRKLLVPKYASPPRIEMAIPYIERILNAPGVNLLERFSAALRIVWGAHDRRDTALARQWILRGVETSLAASEEEKKSPLYEIGKSLVFQYATYLHLYELADSLQVGTEAYLRHLERLWETIGGKGIPLLPGLRTTPYGVQAPPLQAEHWFEYQSTTKEHRSGTPNTQIVRPLPGRANLILFLFSPDISEIYKFKRLKQRFPELEVTVMTQTVGHFGPLLTPSTFQEGELHSKRLLDFWQLPITLGVEKTPFWRLMNPPEDRRRINETVISREKYTFGERSGVLVAGGQIRSGFFFLTDSDGRIVYLGPFNNNFKEDHLEILTDALVKQASRRMSN
jgi:hypothetical protein